MPFTRESLANRALYARMSHSTQEAIDDAFRMLHQSLQHDGFKAANDDNAEALVGAIAAYLVASDPSLERDAQSVVDKPDLPTEAERAAEEERVSMRDDARETAAIRRAVDWMGEQGVDKPEPDARDTAALAGLAREFPALGAILKRSLLG